MHKVTLDVSLIKQLSSVCSYQQRNFLLCVINAILAESVWGPVNKVLQELDRTWFTSVKPTELQNIRPNPQRMRLLPQTFVILVSDLPNHSVIDQQLIEMLRGTALQCLKQFLRSKGTCSLTQLRPLNIQPGCIGHSVQDLSHGSV